MICPNCGKPLPRMTIVQGIIDQSWKVISAISFVCAAVVGQSQLIGQPWGSRLSLVGTVAAALMAWNIKQRPVAKVDQV